jgi:hypothetical protein
VPQPALQPAQGLLLPPSLGRPKTCEAQVGDAVQLGIRDGVVVVLAPKQVGDELVYFFRHIAISRFALCGIHADAAAVERFVQEGVVDAANVSPAAGMQHRIDLGIRIRQIRRIPKRGLVSSSEDGPNIGGSDLDLRNLGLDTDFLPEALIELADKNPDWKGGDLQGYLNRLAVLPEKTLRFGWIVFRIRNIVAVPG